MGPRGNEHQQRQQGDQPQAVVMMSRMLSPTSLRSAVTTTGSSVGASADSRLYNPQSHATPQVALVERVAPNTAFGITRMWTYPVQNAPRVEGAL